jgi:hypothetical protein
VLLPVPGPALIGFRGIFRHAPSLEDNMNRSTISRRSTIALAVAVAIATGMPVAHVASATARDQAGIAVALDDVTPAAPVLGPPWD